MTWKVLMKRLGSLALPLIALAMMAAPSFAADMYLVARPFTAIMPDGAPIAMWGFAQDADGDLGTVGTEVPTVPGPLVTVLPGDSVLNIHVRNELTVPISVVIPGQRAALSPVSFTDGQGRARVKSFAAETAPGGVGTYTWTGLKPGTHLYHSGSHPAVQVQMGLYGAVKIDAAVGEAYAGKKYDKEVILLYSEIDPVLHADVAGGNYGPGLARTSTLEYKPRYFLINGQPYQDQVTPPLDAGSTNQTVLLRFLNAGLRTHVPTLQGSYLKVIAEDGNPYPYAKEQYSVLLAAGKTIDTLWLSPAAGTYPLYDRTLHLTTGALAGGGMLANLSVAAAVQAPTAVDDPYSISEDPASPLVVAAPGVLGNDSNPSGNPLTAILVSGPSSGSLTFAADGSFTYMPNPNFSGVDVFTYKASDGTKESNLANVVITVTPVNDPPVAVADSYRTPLNRTLSVAKPGVLANDSDVEGSVLAAILVTAPASGTLTLNADGSFTYVPAVQGPVTFQYKANDGLADSNVATVTITVDASVNAAPVAVNDTVFVPRNSSNVFINLVANDYDPDPAGTPEGTINPNSVTIVNPPTQGGKVQVTTNGVNYTPKRNFRGTDVFTYTVKDSGNPAATSNVATVRVNVK